MLDTTYIFDQSDYNVHKRFHLLVLGPLSYLIKTAGLDCDEKCKKKNEKIQNELALRGPNEKLALWICRFLKRKERIKKYKLKKKSHEEVEETV